VGESLGSLSPSKKQVQGLRCHPGSSSTVESKNDLDEQDDEA
jgi:hypothetical protein